MRNFNSLVTKLEVPYGARLGEVRYEISQFFFNEKSCSSAPKILFGVIKIVQEVTKRFDGDK